MHLCLCHIKQLVNRFTMNADNESNKNNSNCQRQVAQKQRQWENIIIKEITVLTGDKSGPDMNAEVYAPLTVWHQYTRTMIKSHVQAYKYCDIIIHRTACVEQVPQPEKGKKQKWWFQLCICAWSVWKGAGYKKFKNSNQNLNTIAINIAVLFAGIVCNTAAHCDWSVAKIYR